MQQALIPRATNDGIVGRRVQALANVATAVTMLGDAVKSVEQAAGGKGIWLDEKMLHLLGSARADNQAKFNEKMRQVTDRAIWHHLIEAYGFEKLMDRQAHDEFRAQLDKDPPEVTVESASATIKSLVLDADKIFRRGIANAFSQLDRRFRSHDGFKIGDRVVLSSAFNEYNSWNHYARHQETLRDIERAFYLLDQREMPEKYAGIVGVIDTRRNGHSYERIAYEVEDEFFRVKVFKNGNAHLWFKRKDLVEAVNKQLALHYGEVLGAGSDAVEDDPLARPNTSLAKNLGWFPTPPAVVRELMDSAGVNYVHRGDPPLRILEPSAGEGAIALAIREEMGAGTILQCIEIDAGRAATLDVLGFDVWQDDFLALRNMGAGDKYDRIVMNPPFDAQRDIDHVAHAVRFLAPGGKISAIMSASVEFRDNAKGIAFRALIEKMKGSIRDLPAGSFADSGTMVNTVLVELHAPR